MEFLTVKSVEREKNLVSLFFLTIYIKFEFVSFLRSFLFPQMMDDLKAVISRPKSKKHSPLLDAKYRAVDYIGNSTWSVGIHSMAFGAAFNALQDHTNHDLKKFNIK